MSRSPWIMFASAQTAGEICSWTWPHILSAAGPPLWVGAFILLFPGNLLSSWFIERWLWASGFTLFQLHLIQMPVEIGINAGVWFALWSLLRFPGRLRLRTRGQ